MVPSSSPFDSTREPVVCPAWRTALARWSRTAVAAGVSVLATYLGACLAALGCYALVFPPVTGVQLQRSVEAVFTARRAEHAYEPVPLSRIDADLPLAVVAGEDTRFFLHGGIDWTEVGKAIEAYRNGGELRGASSITQQLVKNLFMTTHSTYLRKALEVPLAYEAELLLSKRRILELYLNVIEWGPGAYGAEAAAQFHYGSSARHLSRAQAAALAACIPNPLHRRPQTVDWYQHDILQRMAQIGRLPLSGASERASLPLPHFQAPAPSKQNLPLKQRSLLFSRSPSDRPLP